MIIELLTGRRQHFIPAAYLGRFSARGTGPLRDRPLWVMRRPSGDPFVRKAADLSFRRDLYTLSYDPDSPRQDLFFIDKLWQSVEQGLPNALDALAHSDRLFLPAVDWVTRLVPFFAGLFVRDPAWESRFEERLDEIMGSSDWRDWAHRDNSKHARLIELTNLAGTLMSASWHVLHFPSSVPLIASDRGYVGHRNPHFTPHDIGYAFPIDPSAVLAVFYARRRHRPRIRWRTDRTVVGIHHHVLGVADAQAFNRECAVYADTEIYGPSAELVREASRGRRVRLAPDEMLLPAAFLAEDRRELIKMRERFLNAYRRLAQTDKKWPIRSGDPMADIEVIEFD